MKSKRIILLMVMLVVVLFGFVSVSACLDSDECGTGYYCVEGSCSFDSCTPLGGRCSFMDSPVNWNNLGSGICAVSGGSTDCVTGEVARYASDFYDDCYGAYYEWGNSGYPCDNWVESDAYSANGVCALNLDTSPDSDSDVNCDGNEVAYINGEYYDDCYRVGSTITGVYRCDTSVSTGSYSADGVCVHDTTYTSITGSAHAKCDNYEGAIDSSGRYREDCYYAYSGGTTERACDEYMDNGFQAGAFCAFGSTTTYSTANVYCDWTDVCYDGVRYRTEPEYCPSMSQCDKDDDSDSVFTFDSITCGTSCVGSSSSDCCSDSDCGGAEYCDDAGHGSTYVCLSSGAANGESCSVNGDCLSDNCREQIDDAANKYCAAAGKECSENVASHAGYDTGDVGTNSNSDWLCTGTDAQTRCYDSNVCDTYAGKYCTMSESWGTGDGTSYVCDAADTCSSNVYYSNTYCDGGSGTAGTCDSYADPIAADSSSASCTCGGDDWIGALTTSGGSTPSCCGDDGTSDDFYTHTNSLTSSTSVSCWNCNNGASGSNTLYGNGYYTGDAASDEIITCYPNTIICSATSRASSATFSVYGNGYFDDGANTCYYGDSQCIDGGYSPGTDEICEDSCVDDNNGGSCVNTHDPSSSETCYYTETCTDSTGCGYSSSDTLDSGECDTCGSTGVTEGDVCPASGTPSGGTCYYGTQSCTGTDCGLSEDTTLYSSYTISSCTNYELGGSSDYCYYDGGDDCYYNTGDSCSSATGWSLNFATCRDPGDVSGTTCYYDNNGGGEANSCSSSGCTGISGQSAPVSCTVGSFANGAMACWTSTTCRYSSDGCGYDADGWDYSSGTTQCSAGTSTCCTAATTIWEGVGCSSSGVSGTSYDRDTSQSRCESTASGCSAYDWDSDQGACCGDDGASDDWTSSEGVCTDGSWTPGESCSVGSDCSSGKYCDTDNFCYNLPLCAEENPSSTGYNPQESNEDHYGGCPTSYDSCSNEYTRTGPNGFCTGADYTCATSGGSTTVSDGDVCQNGNSISPSSSTNCGTGAQNCYCDQTIDCSTGSCSASTYYRGFNGASCSETDKVADTSFLANDGTSISETTYKTGTTCTTSSAVCSGTDSCFSSSYYTGYTCDGSGTCDSYTSVSTLDADLSSASCSCYGHDWDSTEGACCGDDGASDDWTSAEGTCTDGVWASSSTEPTINSLVLNSTSGYNITDDNLTLSISSSSSNIDITDWRENGTSLAVLNMPMEGGTSGTFSATGGTITESGGYRIHTFTSSGSFVSSGINNVEVIVVGGGGAGGGRHGGGGAGGGVVYDSSHGITAQSYTITVGAGGQPTEVSSTVQSVGGNGGNSVFDDITALGGGGGGSYTAAVPTGGGSGGGGGGAQNRNAGLANQGTSGGEIGYGENGGLGGTSNDGGGGGGAGEVGFAATTIGGDGGDGVVYNISGSDTYYAGGAGGGCASSGETTSGGSGGGGSGGYNDGTVGTANTGGGGGGVRSATSTARGKVGGSGIVIIKYLIDSGSGGSVAGKDYSTYSNDGTVSGATFSLTGGHDGSGAYSFDGSNDYIKISDVVVSSPSELTISSWFRKDSGGSTYECVLHQSVDTSIGSSAYWLGVDLNDNLTATIGANTGIGWAVGQTTTVANYGEWYHLAAAWDGSVVRVYINGVYNKQYALSSYTSLATPTRIGASSDGANYQFKGLVDEVQIFDKGLSAEQIASIYADGLANHSITTLVSQETIVDGNYTVMVIPNNGTVEGDSVLSNWLQIVGPAVSISWYDPVAAMDVVKDNLFRVRFNVTCLTGNCGPVNVTLDPIPTDFIEVNNSRFTQGTGTYTHTDAIISGWQIDDRDDRSGGEVIIGSEYARSYSSNLAYNYIQSYPETNYVNLTGMSDDNKNNINISFAIRGNSVSESGSCASAYGTCSRVTCYDRRLKFEYKNSSYDSLGTSNYYFQSYSQISNPNTCGVTTDYWVLVSNDNAWHEYNVKLEDVFPSGVDISDVDYIRFIGYSYGYGQYLYFTNVSYQFAGKGVVPVGSGEPFYTTESSNPKTTSSLGPGESEVVSFWVNATGEPGESYDFFSFANVASDYSVENITTVLNFTIINFTCSSLTGKKFTVENSTGGICFEVNASGMAVLYGDLHESCMDAPVGKSFELASGSDTIGWINDSCDMCIEGTFSAGQTLSYLGTGEFYIEDASDNVLMMADPVSGDVDISGDGCYDYGSGSPKQI